MGIFDFKTSLDEKLNMATFTGANYSTEEIYFGSAQPDMGEGSEAVVRFRVEADITGATSVSFGLVHGALSGPTDGLLYTGAISCPILKGAYIPELKIPDQHLQYLRVVYTVVGTIAAGKITAYISGPEPATHRRG
jgi:hypothetical protein